MSLKKHSCALTLALFSSCAIATQALGQEPLGEAYWQGIRAKADSVLVAEFGKEFREKHIFAPDDPGDYAVIQGKVVDWDSRDTITEPPQWCYFEYFIGLSPGSTNWRDNYIRFTMTPEGERVPPSLDPKTQWDGFAQCNGPCRIPYDGNGFIAIAKKHGVRVRKKDGFKGLQWIPPDSLTADTGERRGHYELALGQNLHKKGTTPTSGGGTYYWNLYKVAVFDLFTGELLRVQEYEEVYQMSSGINSL